MNNPALQIAAARHFLGVAHPDELIDAAHAALDDGIYSYSLGEVATFKEPLWWGLDTLFSSALQELGIVVADRKQAIGTLIEAHLVPLAEGAVAPEIAVRRIHSDYAELADEDWTPQVFELLDPLAQFADMHYRYSYAYEYEHHVAPEQNLPAGPYQQERERLDVECVDLARAWCWNRWKSNLDESWLTSTVVALARGIYDEKAFDRLPILADALQDAGCDHNEILTHCRGKSWEHACGCWVVDLLLGRPWREAAGAVT